MACGNTSAAKTSLIEAPPVHNAGLLNTPCIKRRNMKAAGYLVSAEPTVAKMKTTEESGYGIARPMVGISLRGAKTRAPEPYPRLWKVSGIRLKRCQRVENTYTYSASPNDAYAW